MNKYTILIPSYNDWDCLNLLIPRIDKVAYDIVGEVSILIVNDASTIKNNLSINKLNNVKKIEIKNLLKNVKAQKAVATAIEHLRNIKFDGSIILMDADGQDDPKDISILINKSINEPEKTISVCRLKRQEGLIFKFFYHFYLLITFIFTFKYMHLMSIVLNHQ